MIHLKIAVAGIAAIDEFRGERHPENQFISGLLAWREPGTLSKFP